jgi:hypothetical protein
MINVKTIISISLTVMIALLMVGCGVLTSQTAAPDETSGQTGELPVWLSLAHYETTEADSLNDPSESDGDEGDDFFLGSNTESSQTAPAPAQPTSPAPAAPAPAQSSEPAADSSSESNTTPPSPGTMEYILWQQEQHEAAKEQHQKDKEKEEEKSKTLQERVWQMTFDSVHTPLEKVVVE